MSAEIAVEPHIREALEKGRDYLVGLQTPGGWWKAELETNVTMDAEDMLFREFLGIREEETTKLSAAWIRSQQRSDGSWANRYGGPANLSVTAEAYAALRLAGDPADAEHMRRAAEVVRDLGGLERTRVFTRIWMALFGEWSWDDLPALPPEVIFLPTWFPLNIYDFACWARQTIVALTVVASFKPQRAGSFSVRELRVGAPPAPFSPIHTWPGRFERLDRALHVYERHPLRPLRRQAIRTATEWIIKRQEADGCWGGIQPPWVYSLMALHLLGYPLDHPVVKKGIEGFEGYAIVKDGVRRMEACQSPTWDTCLTGVALHDAGLPTNHPALLQASEWLLDEEIRVKGDWAVRRPDLEPSGWAFEFENDNYPDIDDTAEVVMAFRGVQHPDPEKAKAIESSVQRAVDWTFGMQSADGGWASFDVDNTRALCAELPFCDFGRVTDPPSADVTAHVIEMLAGEGLADDPRVRRGRDWLLRHQEEDGSWFGRWGVNHIYGTGAVVPALIRVGMAPDSGPIRRAVRWVESVQNADGGWGEDVKSYEDASWRGKGKSGPSTTAWALLALLGGGERGASVKRGVDWLAKNQRPDGGWDEREFTGTGFPRDFYLRYHQYRDLFPVSALGRYVEGRRFAGDDG